jgi:hypothetical protein
MLLLLKVPDLHSMEGVEMSDRSMPHCDLNQCSTAPLMILAESEPLKPSCGCATQGSFYWDLRGCAAAVAFMLAGSAADIKSKTVISEGRYTHLQELLYVYTRHSNDNVCI